MSNESGLNLDNTKSKRF